MRVRDRSRLSRCRFRSPSAASTALARAALLRSSAASIWDSMDLLSQPRAIPLVCHLWPGRAGSGPAGLSPKRLFVAGFTRKQKILNLIDSSVGIVVADVDQRVSVARRE